MNESWNLYNCKSLNILQPSLSHWHSSTILVHDYVVQDYVRNPRK